MNPQTPFVVEIQWTCNWSVGTNDTEIHFCRAPSGVGEDSPSEVGIEDAIRQDGTDKRAAGGDVAGAHENAEENFGPEADLDVP